MFDVCGTKSRKQVEYYPRGVMREMVRVEVEILLKYILLGLSRNGIFYWILFFATNPEMILNSVRDFLMQMIEIIVNG